MDIGLPTGTILHCSVYFKIIYILEPGIKNSSEIFHAPCSLIGLDMITGHAVAVAQLKASRALIWQQWENYRKEREKAQNIDRLVIVSTEYWTNLISDRVMVTEFVDKYIRSIPGHSEVPTRF